MWGAIVSVIAGMAMSVQGVMNARLGEGIGTMEANALVQGTAFALSAAALLFYRQGSFARLGEVDRLYWFGGVLGIVITVTVMLGVRALGPGTAVSVILIAQLFTAALIDALGLMGSQQTPFGWTKYAGLALMVAGVVLFKHGRA
jgi:transporter family-2 protein